MFDQQNSTNIINLKVHELNLNTFLYFSTCKNPSVKKNVKIPF